MEMRTTRTWIVATALALTLCVIPLATHAQDNEGALTDELRNRIIQTAYGNASQYVLDSERPLHFALSDFRTLNRRDLRSVGIVDLITLPGGDLLDMNRTERVLEPTGQKWVEWEPEWVRGSEALLEPDLGPDLKLATATGWQVLVAAGAEDPELLETLSATSYQVTVTYANRSRTYRALALWMSDHLSPEFQFRLQDPIVGRIDDAASEAGRLGGQATVDQAIEENRVALFQPESFTCCNATLVRPTQSFSASSKQDHVTGSHYTNGKFTTTCSCNGSCFNTCGMSVSGTCRDSGITTVFSHATGANRVLQSNFAGHAQTVSCFGAYGCAVKFCVLPIFCSATLGIKLGGGGSVSVTSTNASFTPWLFNAGGQCNFCQPKNPSQCGGGGHTPRLPQ